MERGGPKVVKARADEGLPRPERLRKRAEFVAAQGQGKKLHSDNFLVFVRTRRAVDRPPARLGVTVSKKVGGAVARNRVKRMVREAFRRQKKSFPPGIDVVFVAKRAAADVAFVRVVEEIKKLCHRHFAR
jgi:ribonuclease P protein component